MGQGASRPEGGEESSSRASRRRSTLRQSIRHSTIGLDDGEDRLLRGEHIRARNRPAPRSGSANRLSQLLQSSSRFDSADEPVESSRPALLQRTRSTFRDMLSRRESTHTRPSAASRPTPGLLQHRTSYIRAGMSREGGDYYPPRLPSIDHSPTFDHDTFASQDEPEAVPPRSSNSTRRPNLRFDALRPSSRPFRHFTSSLRRRRSPQPPSSSRRAGSEDQAAMLSRLLSVAAAATAATLMGDDHQALSEARSLTSATGMSDMAGGEDGSFDGFLRALQNGRIASALRQGGDSDGENAAREGSLNFFRMFRFGASGSNGPSFQDTRASSGMGDPSEASDNEGRMVPIIIVGIRSISPSSNSGSGSPVDELPPFIDALGNFPSPLPAHALGTHGHDSIDSILRPPQNGTSFRHRRRASMGGFGMSRSRISDRLDDQRDHRSPDRRRERPWSMASSNSEPHAPMPTPASPSPELSRISSRNTTPSHSRPASFVANSVRDFGLDSRRNSVLHRASGASPLSSHTEETGSLHSTHSSTNLLTSGDDPGPFRFHSHRRSDTAPNIHYPRFASGHPRRNGVVEPDNLPPLSRTSTSNATDSTSANNEGRTSNDSRSWIIYVLGGSYPENHPILTTPSLFTDSPTYEDMMLLSALLGPAKAPVATEEDVESAGGIYDVRSVERSGTQSSSDHAADAAKTAQLVAQAVDGDETVELEAGQRCLVCLCEFEEKDVSRKLVKCNHLFHKECIDQVSETHSDHLFNQYACTDFSNSG